MKFSKPLDAILNTEAKIRILRFLCKTDAEWNGSQIAREIGITPAATHAALSALYKEDVLELRNMGKTHVYRLKGGSFLASNLLKPLFAREDRVLDIVVDRIKQKILSSRERKGIISVALYGSVGIRQEDPASDIDIAAVVESAKAADMIEHLFDEVGVKISKEFGNTISPYVNTLSEFRAKHQKGLAVIKNILRSHRLIYGRRLESLL